MRNAQNNTDCSISRNSQFSKMLFISPTGKPILHSTKRDAFHKNKGVGKDQAHKITDVE